MKLVKGTANSGKTRFMLSTMIGAKNTVFVSKEMTAMAVRRAMPAVVENLPVFMYRPLQSGEEWLLLAKELKVQGYKHIILDSNIRHNDNHLFYSLKGLEDDTTSIAVGVQVPFNEETKKRPLVVEII